MTVEAMNNFEVVVEARSSQALGMALDLVMLSHSRFVAWRITTPPVLELYWSKPPHTPVQDFMAPLTAQGVLPNVLQWLESVEPTKPKPDIDGSVSKGFRLTSDCKEGWSYVACRIMPIWALHGK
jgi:hypothetical protein